MAAGARVLDSLYISGYGAAAASGTVAFYQPGTLVSVPVYSDDTLVTLQIQPIVLDANGKTPLPVYTATPARAIIKSAAGTTLQDIARLDGDRAELVGVSNSGWTATDLDSILTAIKASTGGIDGKFLDAGAAAVTRSLQAKFNEQQISVKDYGALGNGIVDDTAAIQATVTRAVALGGSIVYFPPGTYLTSSAIIISVAGVDVLGAGLNASFIKGTAAGQDALTFSAGTVSSTFVNRISRIGFTHATSTTGSAISGNALLVDNVNVVSGKYRFGLTAGNGLVWLATDSNINGNSSDGSSIPVNVTGAAGFVMVGCNIFKPGASQAAVQIATATNMIIGNFIDGSGAATTDGIKITSGSNYIAGNIIGGTANGVNVTGGTAVLSGNAISGTTHGVNVGASGNALIGPGQFISPDILDNRTASTAPVGYSFGTSQAVTPLPLSTQAVRVVATAAITVTVNAVAATGFGWKWSMICSNASGGAVVWSFAAQYVLSAAVAPATGNRVNLLLEYNPIDGKVYEIGRAATAN